MNIDVIRESISLPLLNRGDHVVIHSVGAYNMTQWMQFIALRPHVILIDMDEKPHVIRLRETLDNMNSMEKVPAHLVKFNK